MKYIVWEVPYDKFKEFMVDIQKYSNGGSGRYCDIKRIEVKDMKTHFMVHGMFDDYPYVEDRLNDLLSGR